MTPEAMAEVKHPAGEKEKSTEDSSWRCDNWDSTDPHQQVVTRILKDFKIDLMGIIHISEDGILRSLTADRKVLSAQGLSRINFPPPLGTHELH